jgi:hypothetical protein
VFAGGAIIGGLAYGSASNVQEAFDAMFNDRAPSARALGDRVRAASKHRGPWPRLSVWHGSADAIVKPSNGEHIVSQWLNVQGLQREPSELEQGARHTRRVWNDRNGEPLLEAFSVAGMGHGVPLGTTGRDSCGVVGPFFLDAGISATRHIARFWELEGEFTGKTAEAETGAVVGVPAAYESETSGRYHGAEEGAATYSSPAAISPAEVIAAAFKAAGLPPPVSSGQASANVDPASIIASALKAAGLSRG